MLPVTKISIVTSILCFSQLVTTDPSFGQGRWGGRGGRDDNRPMSSEEIAQRVARTSEFLKQADTNHNGMIDPDEAADPQAKFMLDRIFSRMGKEQRYPMAISEILQSYEAWYRTRAAGGGTPSPGSPPPSGSPPAAGLVSPPGMGFGSPTTPASGSAATISPRPAATTSLSAAPVSPAVVSPAAGQSMASPVSAGAPTPATTSPAVASPATTSPAAASSSSDAKPALRKPGRFLTARERLPKGLPDWFLEKDVNGDGQITMAEFTDNWTPEKLAEFAKYDLNHDGIITAAECLKVEKAKASGK